jgi:hypothetical protein
MVTPTTVGSPTIVGAPPVLSPGTIIESEPGAVYVTPPVYRDGPTMTVPPQSIPTPEPIPAG